MIHHLSLFVMQITAAIFIVVASLLAFVVVRYRQRDPNDDSEPPQIYGSTQIELAWTVIPVLIVLVLFLTTARILFAIQDQKMPATAINADVVGHQFWWEFHYPKYGFTTANELHVPVSTVQAPMTTSLNLLSADVDHSFWAPRCSARSTRFQTRSTTCGSLRIRSACTWGNVPSSAEWNMPKCCCAFTCRPRKISPPG